MKIIVTQDDIDNGQRAHAEKCPLAISVARQTKLEDPSVSTGLVFCGDYEHRRYIYLPKEACDFYRNFDSGLKTEPFEFELPEVTS